MSPPTDPNPGQLLLSLLRRRAELVERTRAFFRSHGVLEVDTPVLQGGASIEVAETFDVM